MDFCQFHPKGWRACCTSTLRLRNIHDKIGGKSEAEEISDAKASYSCRAEEERAGRIAPDHQAPSK
jgi:hypothetical protein